MILKKQLRRNSNYGKTYFYKMDAPMLKLNKANSIFDYKYGDFKIEGYESYPNWKGVPIAV